MGQFELNDTTNLLVEAMQKPDFYDHPVDQVEFVETHISWIFLAGAYAYKVKKPYDLGFLDFSTLEKRRHFCQEELRLNRRFAPQLYLAVIPLSKVDGKYAPGTEHVVEYALKMKRFPSDAQLDRMLAAGKLERHHLLRFAEKIADSHAHLPTWPKTQPFDVEDFILAPAQQNFDQLRPLALSSESIERLDELEHWSRDAFERLSPLIHSRHAQGFVRECHGDIHLANMVWLNNEPVLFDCIEFNEHLRWIDVVNDIAFLMMDLDDRGETSPGWSFLNRYLRWTGDYRGMALLKFYLVYRALVRAKVGFLRLNQEHLTSEERIAEESLARSYLDLAHSYIQPTSPALVITHGFSASGKSTFVEDLSPLCPALSLHSDVERKRLSTPVFISSKRPPREPYTQRRGNNPSTRNWLHTQCWSQMMRHLADSHNVPFMILDFHVAESELLRRIVQRSKEQDTISDATETVLRHQLANADPLGEAEIADSLFVSPETAPETLATMIAKRAFS
ncbi:MAG: AAA family ATPase [Desulfuromonadales bacterium]